MELIIEKTLMDAAKEDIHEQILEAINIKIDNKLKKRLQSKIFRRQMIEKCGKKAFLLPDQMKFPIMNPDTCKIDCKLLYAAYVRARQWTGKTPGYREVANKAKELLRETRCDKKISIHLEGLEQLFYVDDFLYFVE